MATPRRGRRPSRRLWGLVREGQPAQVKRGPLSWADAMDELDIDHDLTLVVQAKTYEQSRSMKGIAVKAASRRYMSIDCDWDGEWLRITAVE